MSGIVGLFHRDGRPADEAAVQRMLATIPHRGRDGRAVSVSGPVGLGLNVLVNTPEAKNEGLLHGAGGALSIVADVRLDNRDELVEALSFPDRPLSEVPDSALLLAAYEKWGERCPERLLGDFAFAIHDRPRERIFCARDHFGLKPFNYHLSEGLFAFGSEVKAVLAIEAVPGDFNEARIADFLIGGMGELCSPFATFHEAVVKLPPAHSLTVGRSGAEERRYWRIEDAPELDIPESDYEESFRDLFGTAVEARLRSAKPVAIMLSGGVDSASIACMAERRLGDAAPSRLRHYSGVADAGFPCAETPSLDVLAGVLTAPSVRIRADEMARFSGEVDRLLDSADDPFVCDMADLRLACTVSAANDGCGAICNGVDGDIITSVTAVVHAAAIESGAVGAIQETWSIWRVHGDWTLPSLRGLAEEVLSTLRFCYVPLWLKRPVQRRRDARRLPAHFGTLCRPELAEQAGFDRRAREFTARLLGPFSSARAVHEARINYPFMAVANDRYGSMVSEFGMESRSPFQDRRLAEFCVALPWKWKAKRGRRKHVLRASMAGVVPDAVRWRDDGNSVLWRGHLHSRRLRAESVRCDVQNASDRLLAYVDAGALRSIGDLCYNPNGEEAGKVAALDAFSRWLGSRRPSGTVVGFARHT